MWRSIWGLFHRAAARARRPRCVCLAQRQRSLTSAHAESPSSPAPAPCPARPPAAIDAFEHDIQIAALRAGLAERAEVTDIDWRAPLDELTRFDVALIGTAWDYTAAKDEFLDRLEALGGSRREGLQFQRSGALECRQALPRDLAERGAATIPTLWPEAASAPPMSTAAFDRVRLRRSWWSNAGSARARKGRTCFTRGDPAARWAGGWTSRR